MKPTLQIKLGNQLTMTPQLQQAIKLLQLSSLELDVEIQAALESNPMLEKIEEVEEGASDSLNTDNESSEVVIPDELPVDTVWEDIYEDSRINSLTSPSSSSETIDFESFKTSEKTLHEHLSWQLNLTPFTEQDRGIATTLIDAISDDGYLTLSLEEIRDSLGLEEPVEINEIEAVLHRIQQFDPIGVGARNLQECMLVQLKTLPSSTPHLPIAMKLVEQYLDLLGQRNFSRLKSRLKLSQEALQSAIALITTLNPKPGSSVQPQEAEYIIPDVIVKKINNRWQVELNGDSAPNIRINTSYSSLIKRADNSRDNQFLKDQLTEARWFLKSIQNRNETLLKVASCIIEEQRHFLDYGEEAMKPLVLSDVANTIGLHESTVSRVTTRKYMHTPRGVFELKYFFSSHVTSSNGQDCSSTAIRAVIKKLIAHENPKKPLSDQKLADLLKEQGITVARRTIAKYREGMNIPPSNQRKKLV